MEQHAEDADLYETLGVRKDASQREIKGAYRRASLLYHPDGQSRRRDPAGRQACQERFLQAAHAYRVLSDPLQRWRYDSLGWPLARGVAPAELASRMAHAEAAHYSAAAWRRDRQECLSYGTATTEGDGNDDNGNDRRG